MKKKIILLLFSALLLTGCKATYELNIYGEDFYETIFFTVPTATIKDDENINYLLNNNIAAVVQEFDGDTAYHVSYETKGKNTEFKLTHQYNKDSIASSKILNNCFENSNSYFDEDTYYIEVSGAFSCLDPASTVEIKITTNLQLTSQNATKIKGNTYIWEINEQNVKDTNIKFSLKNEIVTIKEQNILVSILKVGIILVIIIILIIFIRKFRKNKETTCADNKDLF